MKLEEQVCSLELSKKLKELGVKQKSLWGWVKEKYGFSILLINEFCPLDYENYSAFTVAELGEMLPDDIISRRYSKESPEISHIVRERDGRLFEENTEADARAKMVIYLIKKNWVGVK